MRRGGGYGSVTANSQIEKNSCDVAVKSKVKSVFAGREKRE